MTTVLIRLPAEHYDLFVAACEITSPEYTILKNNIVARHQSSDEQPTVEILCDMEEAKLLLETARRLYPEAVPFIEDAMSVAPEV
ncbi:MAG: hypothetical protein ACXW6J_02300 [Candidatus Binatia bacterium]